ncbi:hypothetical protein ACYPKM_04365 [Pseudomonas aeruginosa]
MSNYITGYWGHIFDDKDGERMTRIVLNQEDESVVAVHVQRDRSRDDSYTPATSVEFDDVKDSINNANFEVYEDPAGYALDVVDEIPAWAVAKAPSKHRSNGLSLG